MLISAASSDRLDRNPGTRGNTAPGFTHSIQKLGVMFQTILEPIILGIEPNEHAGRLAVPCNNDLLGSGQVKIA